MDLVFLAAAVKVGVFRVLCPEGPEEAGAGEARPRPGQPLLGHLRSWDALRVQNGGQSPSDSGALELVSLKTFQSFPASCSPEVVEEGPEAPFLPA